MTSNKIGEALKLILYIYYLVFINDYNVKALLDLGNKVKTKNLP